MKINWPDAFDFEDCLDPAFVTLIGILIVLAIIWAGGWQAAEVVLLIGATAIAGAMGLIGGLIVIAWLIAFIRCNNPWRKNEP